MNTLLPALFASRKVFSCLLSILLTAASASGQTNPAAQTLPYSQDFSSMTHTSTTYPAGWQGWDIGTSASSSFRTNTPTVNRALTASSSASTNSGGVHNYNGKIGILSSGSVDPAVALAISTTGLSGIKVSYDIMTIRNPYDGSSNTRINEATLQYRVGTSGAFTSLTGIEYSNNTTTQTTAVTTPQNTQSKSVTLPAACNNQSVVQLRWVMRDVSGGGGRPSFAVDNISVCPTPVFSLDASPSVCRGVTSTTLSYTATSGFSTPNQYSIDFDAAANTAGFVDVPLTALPAGSIAIAVPEAAAAAVYNATLTIQNACGGSATADFTVTVNALPACSIAGPDYVCNNTSGITYSAPAGMSNYNWSVTNNGSIPGSTAGQSVSVTSGNFLNTYTVSVTITDANGCVSTCSKVSDIFLQTPPANITVNPNPACFGTTLDLSIVSASSSTVSWTGEGITNPNGTFTPTGDGYWFYNQTTAVPTTTGPRTYSVTVTAGYGIFGSCSNTGTASVTVNPLPPAPSCPSNLPVCLNTPAFLLTGGSPAGGVYSGPGVSSGTFDPVTAGAGPKTITYTVTDGNGCSNSCTFAITVNSPPAPTCPSGFNVCNTATPFALTGGAPGGGTYSGTGVSAGIFNPSAAGTGMHAITYTVTDGNNCTNTCTFSITVETCSSIIDFSGNIKFSNNTALGVNNALVTLTGSASGSDLSDTNGDYFISTALTNGSFTLKPTKTTLKLNGVTVADATAVQQHVSLANPITDPYKLVAADVNKSNSITTVDASIINQALLGNPTALAQFKTSWRFVPTSHTMTNPPWGFPEQRTYTNISGPQVNQDFFGIKTGDIVTAFANPANFGAGAPLVLTLNDQRLEAGKELDIPVRAGQLNDLAAFQCALAFDPAQLQLIAIEPAGGLPLSADNFGTYQKDAGEIRVVWAGNKGLDVAEAAPVFRLRLKALQSGAALSEVLRLDGDILPALSYNSRLEESAVALQFETATTGAGDPARDNFRLLPNRPNPFSAETTIGFVLPQACEAQLRIFDATGRLLMERKGQYPAGRSEERLYLEGAAGLLWYELTTPFGTLTKTMTAL